MDSTPSLPFEPVLASAVNVAILGSLIASAQQQNDLLPSQGVIDPVSGPPVDSNFPYTVAAEPVIPEIAWFHAIDPPVDCDFRLGVPDLISPLHKNVMVVQIEIVADLVHI
jgi:hypothetical protein